MPIARSPVLNWALLALGAIALALIPTGLFRTELLNPGGWPQLWRFLQASVHPDLSLTLLQTTATATLTTLAYALCGSVLSVILGAMGGLLCSQVWWQAVLPRTIQQQPSWLGFWFSLRALLAVPRAIHELIWGLILINVWGTDPLTGIVAIALPFGAVTAKIFSEILDDTPRDIWQALLSSGAPPLSAFFYSLLPQAFLNLVSYALYRFECSLRSAAVLGMIGVGGLGTEIQVSLQSLRYEQLWTFFYALVALNGLVDGFSASLRHQLGCTSRLDLNQGSKTTMGRTMAQGTDEQRPQATDKQPFVPTPMVLGVGVLFAFALCFHALQPNLTKLTDPQSHQRLQLLLADAFPPDLSFLGQLPLLAAQTVAMSVLAIALAASGGTVLAFLAARSLVRSWVIQMVSRGLLLLTRAIPAPVWALVLLYVWFPGILPGAIALGLHNLGILGRLQAEVIENLETAPLKSLQNQGIPTILIFFYGILPMTLPRFLAYDLYRWEVCMRETVIVGLVGAGGLGYLMMEQVSSFDTAGLGVTLGTFLLLTFVVDWISNQARCSLH